MLRSTQLPSHQFTEWSDTDHSGAVIITTVLCLIYWLVPGVGQQVISFDQTGMLSWADYLYVASMIVGLAQSVLILVASSHGLGKSTKVMHTAEAMDSLRLYHASNVLYVLVLGLAKCSATCSVINLTVPNRGSIRWASVKHKTVFGVVTALAISWMVKSIIALGLQCEPGHAASPRSNSCDGTMATWIGMFASDGITDLIIAGFAASIIWPTKARVRLKLVWYMPLFIRLCLIILSGVRLAAFHPASIRKDPTITMWLFIVLTQIQVFLSLIAAGFPALKNTVLDLVTNFGVSEDSQNRSRRGPGYILSSLTRKGKRTQPQESNSSFSPYAGGTRGNSVVRSGTNRATSEDDDSQKGIIRQDEYDVIITNVGPADKDSH